MTDIAGRDGGMCVASGGHVHNQAASVHHRILGNRSDNRPSNLILLLGSGTTSYHGWVHNRGRGAAQDVYGYIVTRHGAREATLTVPVFYYQPHLGRVGWYLLDDDGKMTAVDAGPHPGPVQLERGTRYG